MAVTARQNNKQRKDGNPPLSNANRLVIMSIVKVVVVRWAKACNKHDSLRAFDRRGAWRGGPPSFVQSHQNSRGPGGPLQGQHGYGSPQPPRSPLHGIENALVSHCLLLHEIHKTFD